MEEWSVLTSSAHNQKFNTYDGGMFAWEAFWPKLASWYGVDWSGPQDDVEYTEIQMPHNPRGYGGKALMRRRFSLVDWVKQEKVQKAWAELVSANGLEKKELEEPGRVFGFADGSMSRGSSLMFRLVKYSRQVLVMYRN